LTDKYWESTHNERKARSSNFEPFYEHPVNTEAQQTLSYNHSFRFCSSAEEWKSLYSRLFRAGGVPGFFISARAVGEGRPIVVMVVGRHLSEKHTALHRKNIAKQQRVGRSIGNRKEGEECKILKKTWLIHLQHQLLSMIDYLKITRLWSLVAIFVVKKVWLSSIFPDGAMEDGNQ
jgi:hypothetical protein